ncbi:hypothetical protein [Aeoliella mucimassa]|uniref:Uncharacterized protein n=1 Tax=Aeoliella mucimassa TaxID=2527972 RepID=A0A518AUB8_9BACT|nr:hypothetical protein [Aeoliella mucimassa]QDU58324.1 hypothetical protein Pan181_45580 [Aeoliella mucimassa]
MAESATKPEPKNNDAISLDRAKAMMIEGIKLQGVVKCVARGPRTYEGKQREVMKLEGMGFTHTMYGENPADFRHWPFEGDWVHVKADVTQTRDGTLRIAATELRVVASENS